ncbi:hypothetical protein Sjap_003869 [Stephania japonica]|uniref:Myb-like domain-containing protein n=1 Tax=Stephania japonica TaxID=461633 RepID=A0AAP0KS18_9MAGN
MRAKIRASKARVSKIPSKSTSALARLHSETVSLDGVDDSTERLDQSPAAKIARVSKNDGTCVAGEAKSGNELGISPGSCSSGGGISAAPAANSERASHKDARGEGLVKSLGGLVNWECPQTFGWTEQRFCVKCNEAGEGRAISELDEMEKELASAKEKAHVARDLLCAFINGGCEKQTIQMKEHCKSMEIGGKESSTAVIDQQEAVDAGGGINEISRVDASLVSKGAGATRTSGEQTEGISSPNQKSKEDQQVAASAADIPSNSYANERCGVLSGADNHSKQGDSSRNRSTVNQQNITATTDVLIPNSGIEGRPECSKPIDPQDESSSEQVSESIESAEDKNLEKTTNSKSVKSNKPPMRSTNPAIPNSKRKKLIWTTEEEEMLKVAVKKFTNGRKNLSWKSILDFGSHVFNASRSPVDLKDKWRNMEKANSRGR